MNKMLLNISGVSFAYQDMKDYLFENVKFSIYSGDKIGLLGYNGSGKSTLLDIVKGQKSPDTGEIARQTENIFYLRQEDYAVGNIDVQNYLTSSRPKLHHLYEEINAIEKARIPDPIKYAELLNEFKELDGYEFIQRIKKIITIFGFPEEDMERRVDTFSGGERRLLKLASGFVEEYDLFLLDEPTNYLDDAGIEFLINAIHSSRAAFLIVSHDRWFLDETVKEILEIERKKIQEYTGNYSVFINTKETELKEKTRKKKKIESEIKHLRELERSYKIWAKRREKDKIGAGDKGFISHRAAKLMKRSIQSKERIQKRIEELKQTKPYIEKWYDFRFENTFVPKGACLTVNRLAEKINDRLLFKEFCFTTGWGEKVAILGPNGSGKTTLLEIILNIKAPDEGEVIWSGQTNVGYLPQQWNPDDDEKEVSELFREDQWDRARILLGCLKVKGGNFHKMLGGLSEGQKRKIKLVSLIMSEPNVLILDEPTTHLDYVTVEILEKALKDFKGTIILVTHDKFLRERIQTREIKIQKSNR
jgi:ATPase subunit of ABC transporter with duplicated ATPase domains